MQLTLTSAALAALQKKVGDVSTFALALNDGSNQFSNAGGACMIGDRFQLVPLHATTAPFTEKILATPVAVYISTYETIFLGEHPLIDFDAQYYTFVLKNETGLVDSNLLINEKFLVNS